MNLTIDEDKCNISLSKNEAAWLYEFIWQHTFVINKYTIMQGKFMNVLEDFNHQNYNKELKVE